MEAPQPVFQGVTMSGLNSSETNMLSESIGYIDRALRTLRSELESLGTPEGGLKGLTITLDADEANWLVVYLSSAKTKVNTVKQMKGYYPK